MPETWEEASEEIALLKADMAAIQSQLEADAASGYPALGSWRARAARKKGHMQSRLIRVKQTLQRLLPRGRGDGGKSTEQLAYEEQVRRENAERRRRLVEEADAGGLVIEAAKLLCLYVHGMKPQDAAVARRIIERAGMTPSEKEKWKTWAFPETS